MMPNEPYPDHRAREALRQKWASLPPAQRKQLAPGRPAAEDVLRTQLAEILNGYGFHAEDEADSLFVRHPSPTLSRERLRICLDVDGAHFWFDQGAEAPVVPLAYDPQEERFYGPREQDRDGIPTFASPVDRIVVGVLDAFLARFGK